MSTTYINADLRRRVVARAEGICEYCLIHQDDTLQVHEADHVVSEKHGGATNEDNLALACFVCNRNKGSDVAALVPGTQTPVRFFNPRTDRWREHFYLNDSDGVTIEPLTDIGEATARIFGFNTFERLLEWEDLRQAGRYPTEAARRRVNGS